MNIRCIKCKGRDPSICGRTFCPIMAKISSQKKVNLSSKQDFFGKSPNIFVGRFGYPDVNVGILSTEQYDHHDEPLLWSRENYEIAKIIDLRSSLINSNFKTSIKSFNDRLLGMSQEISMAKEPVDVEVSLSKKPVFSLSFGQDVTPHGPSILLKKARITENPKIPHQIDKAVSDIDLKAGDALKKLYKSEFDEHYLSKLLSTGSLGVKAQRKLVPTRWSITAVDDTLAKQMINEVKDYSQHDYSVFFGGFLGNYYVTIFLPEVWSYELFETYVGKSTWHDSEGISVMTDHEGYDGRKDYASDTAGGYYAARLGVLEYLKKNKRQATVILLRFITGEYYAPLGVWVVREAVRKTMANKPMSFDSEELLFRYVRALVKKKFNLDADLLLKKSLLLRRAKTQTKLGSFLS
jgi:DNA repair protein NreA